PPSPKRRGGRSRSYPPLRFGEGGGGGGSERPEVDKRRGGAKVAEGRDGRLESTRRRLPSEGGGDEATHAGGADRLDTRPVRLDGERPAGHALAAGLRAELPAAQPLLERPARQPAGARLHAPVAVAAGRPP